MPTKKIAVKTAAVRKVPPKLQPRAKAGNYAHGTGPAVMGGPLENEPALAEFPPQGPAAPLTPSDFNPTISDFQARMFRLRRDEDHTGATGAGIVAEGVEWTDGTVTVRWKHGETTQHNNLKTLATMHFNRGNTSIVWM